MNNLLNGMKRILMIGAFIILGTSLSFAQLQVGAVAGLNTSTQSGLGDIWDNNGIRCNINSGLVAHYRINDWFALKSGVIYAQKGTSLDIRQNGLDVKQVDKFRYVEIPFKAEFASNSGVKNHRLFASVGPYAAFLVDSKRELNDSDSDLKDLTNSTDFGISWELGVDIPFSKNNMQIYLNYDMGLSEIAKYNSDLKNKSLSLNIAWIF